MRGAVLIAAALALLATAAQAHSIGAPGVSVPGGGSAQINPPGGGAVGTVLTGQGVPSGSTCQWLRGGSSISGATSCAGYTTVTADGGQTVSLQVDLPGAPIASGSGSTGDLDFTQASNSASAAIISF